MSVRSFCPQVAKNILMQLEETAVFRRSTFSFLVKLHTFVPERRGIDSKDRRWYTDVLLKNLYLFLSRTQTCSGLFCRSGHVFDACVCMLSWWLLPGVTIVDTGTLSKWPLVVNTLTLYSAPGLRLSSTQEVSSARTNSSREFPRWPLVGVLVTL